MSASQSTLSSTPVTSVSNISLFIPHVYSNITSESIIKAFHESDIGEVKRVDLVAKMNDKGERYNTAYIHFNNWYQNTTALNFYERVVDPNKQARLVYDDPWFWIVLENATKKHNPSVPRMRLDLSDKKSSSVSAAAAAAKPLVSNVSLGTNALGNKLLSKIMPTAPTTSTNVLGRKILSKIMPNAIANATTTSAPVAKPAIDMVHIDYVEHIEAMNASLRDELNMSECVEYQLNDTIVKLQNQMDVLYTELGSYQTIFNTMHQQQQQQYQELYEEQYQDLELEPGQIYQDL